MAVEIERKVSLVSSLSIVCFFIIGVPLLIGSCNSPKKEDLVPSIAPGAPYTCVVNSKFISLYEMKRTELVAMFGKPDFIEHTDRGDDAYNWDNFDSIEWTSKGVSAKIDSESERLIDFAVSHIGEADYFYPKIRGDSILNQVVGKVNMNYEGVYSNDLKVYFSWSDRPEGRVFVEYNFDKDSRIKRFRFHLEKQW